MTRPNKLQIRRGGLPKDIADLVHTARQQGWTVTYTGGHHLRWQSPTGGVVFSSSTPTTRKGPKALAGMRSDLRRAGLELT